ncbi:hypothetical protein [Albibacterium profundi]|uniref:Uncharacterized protein n=1 Tax=Albibacterium profundi TaxID=3134906 RepID=A0ABV5CEY1_9SPHI
MTEDKEFDKIQAERNELNVLLDKGLKFEIDRFFPFNLGKRKKWTFVIKEPYLGTLDRISNVSIDMDISENSIQEDPWSESKSLVKKHAFKAAKVIAIAYLNNLILIKLFTRVLAYFFKWTIKPSKLYAYASYMNVMCNFGDFTNSIRLISASRTTLPVKRENLIEGNSKV